MPRIAGGFWRYPKQANRRGDMYAFRLPASIPAAGTSRGPPLAANQRYLFGTRDFNFRDTAFPILRDPAKLGPTVQAMMAKYQEQQKQPAQTNRK